jgi:hypothetical protein
MLTPPFNLIHSGLIFIEKSDSLTEHTLLPQVALLVIQPKPFALGMG